MSEYPPTGLDDEFRFGKYEGEPVWVVLEEDPRYVRWLIEEADLEFRLDDEAWAEYQEIIRKHGSRDRQSRW